MDKLTIKAKQGNAEAQYRLGSFYLFIPQVDGSKVDFAKVAECFTEAANRGHIQAQYNLGLFYLGGTGVDRDITRGIEWITKSAMQGDDNAQYVLGMLYLRGDNSDNDEAGAILQVIVDAAGQGNTQAKFVLGLAFLMGSDKLGTERDATAAFEWFRKSAEQGNAHTQRIIGMCYEKGVGVVKDIDEANKWYAKAVGLQTDGTEEIAETESSQGKTAQEPIEELLPPPATFGDTNATIKGETQHYYWHYVLVGFFSTIAIVGTILAWRCLRRKQT